MFRIRRRRTEHSSRRGVAAAELALVLPIFLLLVMASIEACVMIFLDHSLTIATYQGARVAINYDATTSEVLDCCNHLIEAREVNDATVTLNPSNVALVPRGQPIEVTVSAPCDSNSITSPWFFGGKTISVTTTMVKE